MITLVKTASGHYTAFVRVKDACDDADSRDPFDLIIERDEAHRNEGCRWIASGDGFGEKGFETLAEARKYVETRYENAVMG